MLKNRHPLNRGGSSFNLVETTFNGLFFKGRAGRSAKGTVNTEKRIKLNQRAKLRTQLEKPFIASIIATELNISLNQFGPFIARLLLKEFDDK